MYFLYYLKYVKTMVIKGKETVVSVTSISTAIEKGIVHVLMLSFHNNRVGEFRGFLISSYFVFQKHTILCTTSKNIWISHSKIKGPIYPYFPIEDHISSFHIYILGCQWNIKMSLPNELIQVSQHTHSFLYPVIL